MKKFNFTIDKETFQASKIFLRILSVLIAFLLWTYVNSGRADDAEKVVACEVHFLNPSSELTVNLDSSKINVGVKGSREAVASLTQRDVLCEVDIRGMGPGKYRLPVKVVLPGATRLDFVDPANVEVSLVRYGERVMPLKVSVQGGLPAGLLMDSVELDPQEVTVKGPEDDIASVTEAFLQPTVEDLQKGEKLVLPVRLTQSEGVSKDLVVDPPEAELSAILRKGLPRKIVPIEASVAGDPEPGMVLGSVALSPSFAEVEGSEEALKGLDKIETETIDITGFSQNRSMIVPLRPLPLKDLQVMGEPSVSVNVVLRPKTSVRLFRKVPVAIKGKSVYPAWTMSPETVDVKLEGPASLIDSLPLDQIPLSVYVDVTNIVSRQLKVPVSIRLGIGDLKVLGVDPERVTVRAKID